MVYGSVCSGIEAAIGNSMAVPVMRWIGTRIDHVGRVLRQAP